MADSQVSLEWSGEGLRFEAAHPQYPFRTDGDAVSAHSPVQSLLLALGGCMAADVVDIVGKMRVPITGLSVRVEGDRNAEPPRYFKAIRMHFDVRGVTPQQQQKIENAIQLSRDKYCSVFHTLRSDIVFSTTLALS